MQTMCVHSSSHPAPLWFYCTDRHLTWRLSDYREVIYINVVSRNLYLQKSCFSPVHIQQLVMQIKGKTVPSRSRVDVHEARASAPHLHYGTRGLACWSRHPVLSLTSFLIPEGSCVHGHLLLQLVLLNVTVIKVRWSFLVESK